MPTGSPVLWSSGRALYKETLWNWKLCLIRFLFFSPLSFLRSFACSSATFSDGLYNVKWHNLLFSHESACSVCVCVSVLSLHVHAVILLLAYSFFKNWLVCIISFIILHAQVGLSIHSKQSKVSIFLLSSLFITKASASFHYPWGSEFVWFWFSLSISQTGVVSP